MRVSLRSRIQRYPQPFNAKPGDGRRTGQTPTPISGRSRSVAIIASNQLSIECGSRRCVPTLTFRVRADIDLSCAEADPD